MSGRRRPASCSPALPVSVPTTSKPASRSEAESAVLMSASSSTTSTRAMVAAYRGGPWAGRDGLVTFVLSRERHEAVVLHRRVTDASHMKRGSNTCVGEPFWNCCSGGRVDRALPQVNSNYLEVDQ